MRAPPPVDLGEARPLQGYYRDRDGNRYSVAKLIDDASELPVFDVPLAALDLSDCIWNDQNVAELAWHVKKCVDADMSFPILIAWDGVVADGRHRVINALMNGVRTIKARRLAWKPEPDKKADDA